MSSEKFNSRVYGCAIIKAVNSNYNADFSGQPRRLPNGVVYATDKALKYSVRNYWQNLLNEKVFYFKSLDEKMTPRTLDETYQKHFGEFKEKNEKLRIEVLKNLLTRLDVRVFGGTYAGKTNISIHGTCQITHGVNRYGDNNVIYSEQIMSPFRNPGEKNADSTMTTLGSQSKLEEGHYVHHFSVNPKNIEKDAERVGSDGLTNEDIEKLKKGLSQGVSYYDSSAKSGTENELLLWVELKEESKLVLPSLVELVDIKENRDIDLKKVKDLLSQKSVKDEIKKIELFYNKQITNVINEPDNCVFKEI